MTVFDDLQLHGDDDGKKEKKDVAGTPSEVQTIQQIPKDLMKSPMTLQIPMDNWSDMRLTMMVNKLSINDVILRDETDEADDDGDDDNDDKHDVRDNDDDEDEDNIVYTERGPMMGRRYSRNRRQPYDVWTGGLEGNHSSNVNSPASSNEANDSESSVSSSSPDSSPRHSVSIPIPSRPHYGSVGVLTVVSPIPSSILSGGSPEPQDEGGRRCRSLCAGGGLLVTSTAAIEATQPKQSCITLPAVTIAHQVQPPNYVAQLLTYDNVVTLSKSSYDTYRDTASASSPISAHSPSTDDCLAATPSPRSDVGFHSSYELSSDGSLHDIVDDVVAPLIPLSSCNIDELFETFLGDLGLPDKREFNELYGTFPVDSNGERRSQSFSDLVATGDEQFVVPQQSSTSPLQNNLLFPILQPSSRQCPRSPVEKQEQQQQASGRSRRNSNSLVEMKYNEKMKSYAKILPKNTPVVAVAPAALVVTPIALPDFPSTSSVPSSVTLRFPDAVENLRALSTDSERNKALVTVEQWSVDEVCKPDANGDTDLHISVGNRNFAFVYAIVKILVEKSRSVDLRNKSGQTPLFVAVAAGHPTLVKFLLNRGADVNCVCRDGTTPLLLAISNGDANYDVVKLLCSCDNVNYSHANSKGLTALHCAVQCEKTSIRIAQLMVQSGASVTDQERCSGKTPMHLAIEKGKIQMVKALCEAVPKERIKASMQTTTFIGDTLLHSAAIAMNISKEDRLELINLLLAHGANPAVKNNNYKLPRDLLMARLDPDPIDKAIRKALSPKSNQP